MSLTDIHFGFDISPLAWDDKLGLKQNIDRFEKLLWRCRQFTSTAIGFAQGKPSDTFSEQLRALALHAMKLNNAALKFYSQPTLYARFREIAKEVPAHAGGKYESNASAHGTMLALLAVVLDRMATIHEFKSDEPWPNFGFTENVLFELELETRKEFALIRSEVPVADGTGDPEDVEAKREDLLRDSPTTVDESLEMLETPPPSDYTRLWDYANKKWSKGTDNYKLCWSISNGPGNYSDCVEDLIPNVGRTRQTKRFHAVMGAMNNTIRVELGLEVYRDGEQVLIRQVVEQTPIKPKAKQAGRTKKTRPKRKLR